MRIAAVISEYNPFHNGHLYLVDQIKKLGFTHVISVMSGDFVQRGEVAIMCKWARTRSALNLGVDLVLELPTIFSVGCAERFALGANYILESLGVVDCLIFGSESADVQTLKNVAKFVMSKEFSDKFRSRDNRQKSFAVSREEIVCEKLGHKAAKCLSTPNDTLAIEYIKSLKKINSSINPIAIKRICSVHDTGISSDKIASASMIRELIHNGGDFQKFMPSISFEELKNEVKRENAPAKMSYAQRAMIAKLRCLDKNQLENVIDVSEGLENRIFNAVKDSVSLEELYGQIKTKRYTHARIRRIILCAFLGLNKNYEQCMPSYIRALGFNDRGREILNNAKHKTTLPIITRMSDLKWLDDVDREMFNIENRCENLYSVFTERLKKSQIYSSIYLRK